MRSKTPPDPTRLDSTPEMPEGPITTRDKNRRKMTHLYSPTNNPVGQAYNRNPWHTRYSDIGRLRSLGSPGTKLERLFSIEWPVLSCPRGKLTSLRRKGKREDLEKKQDQDSFLDKMTRSVAQKQICYCEKVLPLYHHASTTGPNDKTWSWGAIVPAHRVPS